MTGGAGGEGPEKPQLRLRRSAILVLIALFLTIASAQVPGRAKVSYPEIMGCEQSCEVVAAGFPVPFIADYPGLSVVNAVSWSGMIVGEDKLLWEGFVGSFAAWLTLTALALWIVRRFAGSTVR